MTIDVNHGVSRRSRFLYPALIVSLGLNLLFIGGLSAAAWHFNSRHTRGEFGLLAFARQLPVENQEAFRKQVLDSRASLADEREAVRDAWLEVNSMLTREPFDKDKLKEAMAKLRDTENQFRSGLNNSFAEIAGSVTPEQRKLLQAWRDKRKPHFLRRSEASSAKTDGAAKSE